ncbi:predicted protein [Arabidopsis lyrata subsp. lyrata]|uniref:Predicted protein n=1 Tax=Arabidopsis lyrata subsp. lyrata TaxID=81972 RepID=D7L0Z0_ARALL|nr:predicted protein [Arabidopsis lyrata subsp. lyrata]
MPIIWHQTLLTLVQLGLNKNLKILSHYHLFPPPKRFSGDSFKQHKRLTRWFPIWRWSF